MDAIVAENGAVALAPDLNEISLKRFPGKRHQLSKTYQQDQATRKQNFTRMQAVLARIEAQVPGAHRAQDSAGRETDIAIDHSEFTHLPQNAIDECVALMRAAGMNATVSSIHLNGWYGEHDKLQAARYVTQGERGAGFAELVRVILNKNRH